MRFLAGLAVCLCAAPSYAGTPETPDRFKVPPLEFAVDLNGQENLFAEGETRQVNVNGRTVPATLDVKPTRLLQTPHFSFRFPNQFEFERDHEAESWTITLGSSRMMVGLITDKTELAEGIDPVLREAELDRGQGTIGPSEFRLGDKKLAGRILRGKKDGVPYEVEGYFVPVDTDTHYYLLMMHLHMGDAAVESATASARRIMTDTFALKSVRRGTATAPLEFVLKLDGVSLDVKQDIPGKATVGQAPVEVLITALMRVLRTPELAMRYPEFYEFAGETDAGTDKWLMKGRQQKVLLIRTPAKAEAAKAVQRVIDDLSKSLGRPSATKPVATTFAGVARKGTRAEFKKDGLTIASELFPFTAGEAGYVLAFQEATKSGSLPEHEAFLRKSIEESLTLTK